MTEYTAVYGALKRGHVGTLYHARFWESDPGEAMRRGAAAAWGQYQFLGVTKGRAFLERADGLAVLLEGLPGENTAGPGPRLHRED